MLPAPNIEVAFDAFELPIVLDAEFEEEDPVGLDTEPVVKLSVAPVNVARVEDGDEEGEVLTFWFPTEVGVEGI